MLYVVHLWVRLDSPIESSGDGNEGNSHRLTGYVVSIGVNAPEIMEAIAIAHDAVFGATDGAREPDDLKGQVEEVQAKATTKEDLAHEVLTKSKTIDEPGVFFRSGRCFLDHDAEITDGMGEVEDAW